MKSKELKNQEAVARNSKWEALSFENQLEALDNTFGKDQGAAKQRAKIANKIQIRDSASKKKGKK
ncbi:MAG: hypothetical protein U9N54_07915 [candidate division Zixibacteria bacterium]|nr:hypothetical protein [candidate division Zixibacteria bacterium]